MPDRSDLIYRYDGSFDGLMCCVYDSFYRKELPLSIIDNEEPQHTLFDIRDVITDRAKAARVKNAIGEKISYEALGFIRNAFLTNLRDREIHILKFVYLGFTHRQVMRMLTNNTVNTLNKAVTNMLKEAERLRGFVRFSDFGGGLVAVIEPKNNVLPILRNHFVSRYPEECFIIYDKTHSLILAAQNGKSRIMPIDEFTPPSSGSEEMLYRALWRRFYDTIAVEGRENPKCRLSHMPKRYWANMTEMQAVDCGAISGDTEKTLTDGKSINFNLSNKCRK